MKTKPHSIKNVFQAIIFLIAMFYYSSCSNNSSENSWQENQENKNPGIVKQDTTFPPHITILENLADSSKPKEIFLEKRPKPQAITIPKVAVTSYILQTKSGPKKIELSPPNQSGSARKLTELRHPS